MAREIVPGFTVAPVEDSDEAGLMSLIGGCFAEYADEGVQLDPADLDADLKAWSTYLQLQDGEGWKVLDPKGNLIACIGYTSIDETLFELKRLYLHADHRGGRLAVRLLTMVEDAVLKRGGEILMLWSDSRFKRAHNFYRREGFVHLGSTRALGDISNTTELQFIKSL